MQQLAAVVQKSLLLHVDLVARQPQQPHPQCYISLPACPLLRLSLPAGEALPPLKVAFVDKYGNPVGMSPAATPPSLSIAVAAVGPDGEAQPCEELEVAAQQAAVEDGMMITGLQLLGSAEAAAAAASGCQPPGLALLAGGGGLSHPTARQAQAAPSRQSLPVAEVQLRVSLASAPDLEPVVLPLRLRAGAPQSLRLLGGHPWEEAGGEAVALQHGAALPAFQVAAYDAWGNPTAPSTDLPFVVVAECDATAPGAHEFSVSALGMAAVEGGSKRWLQCELTRPAACCRVRSPGLRATRSPALTLSTLSSFAVQA